MEGTKVCTKCGTEKELNKFFKDSQKPDGLRPDCKECSSRQSMEWAKNNKEKRKYYIIKNKTGLTKEQYEDLISFQQEGCAICGKTIDENGKNLAIDHCHNTGLIRGILCHSCNYGLGYFTDSEEKLLKAIDYLKNNYSIKEIKHK